MNKFLLLLGTGLLATTVAAAQSTGSTDSSAPDQSTPGSQTYHSQTSQQVVRGCLSGSTGNFTLTDQNGMQYTVTGDDSSLQAQVGHEVEITSKSNQSSQTSTQPDGSTTKTTTNSIQMNNIRQVSATCSHAAGSGMTPNPSSAPDQRHGTPLLMAMLMQQSTNSQPATQQTTPPVTSQTPTASTSPTAPAANSQVGTSPANNTGMTESQANHDAQAARQGELNTNSQTGDTTGRGINNQGVNNPTSTSPNAVPTSSNSATPAANSQQPANANDASKPLYERQASDIPWANQSGNNGTNPPPH